MARRRRKTEPEPSSSKDTNDPDPSDKKCSISNKKKTEEENVDDPPAPSKKKQPRKKPADDEDEDEDVDKPAPSKKPKPAASKKNSDQENEDDQPALSKKRASSKKKPDKDEDDDAFVSSRKEKPAASKKKPADDPPAPSGKNRRAASRKKAEDDEEDADDPPAPSRKKRPASKKKPKDDSEASTSKEASHDNRPTRRIKTTVVDAEKDEDYQEDENDDEDDGYDSPPSKKSRTNGKMRRGDRKENLENEDPNAAGLKKSFKDFTTGPVVRFYEHYQFGKINTKIKHCLKESIINHVKSFKWYKAEACFDRRVTFIEWHPTEPKTLAVASKSGDIILWNYENPIDPTTMIKGSGAGGSIQALKFDPYSPDYIYTVSVEGKFLKVNFKTKKMVQYLATNDLRLWYCSCDVNFEGKVMVAGDNKGVLKFLTTDGESLWEIRGGKTKITHAEFSKREPWLLCTSTGEQKKTPDGMKTVGVVKHWDIRYMNKDNANEAQPLHTIYENFALNGAYFSLTDGNRLLTTDQWRSIKVYRSPLWYEETSIEHPHRQFQHLTQIRAYWHPLEDIIVCGRYPDVQRPILEGDSVGKDGLRTIDFFDADTGKLLHQHSSPGFNGIYCLNRFNHYGDAFASGTGRQIVIWKHDYKDQEKSDRKFFDRRSKKGDDDDDDDDDDDKKKPDVKNKKDLFNKTSLVQRPSPKKLKVTLKGQ